MKLHEVLDFHKEQRPSLLARRISDMLAEVAHAVADITDDFVSQHSTLIRVFKNMSIRKHNTFVYDEDLKLMYHINPPWLAAKSGLQPDEIGAIIALQDEVDLLNKRIDNKARGILTRRCREMGWHVDDIVIYGYEIEKDSIKWVNLGAGLIAVSIKPETDELRKNALQIIHDLVTKTVETDFPGDDSGRRAHNAR